MPISHLITIVMSNTAMSTLDLLFSHRNYRVFNFFLKENSLISQKTHAYTIHKNYS